MKWAILWNSLCDPETTDTIELYGRRKEKQFIFEHISTMWYGAKESEMTKKDFTEAELEQLMEQVWAKVDASGEIIPPYKKYQYFEIGKAMPFIYRVSNGKWVPAVDKGYQFSIGFEKHDRANAQAQLYRIALRCKIPFKLRRCNKKN